MDQSALGRRPLLCPIPILRLQIRLRRSGPGCLPMRLSTAKGAPPDEEPASSYPATIMQSCHGATLRAVRPQTAATHGLDGWQLASDGLLSAEAYFDMSRTPTVNSQLQVKAADVRATVDLSKSRTHRAAINELPQITASRATLSLTFDGPFNAITDIRYAITDRRWCVLADTCREPLERAASLSRPRALETCMNTFRDS